MATKSKSATSPKTIVATLKDMDEVKREALDVYLKAEDRADAASKNKKTAKGLLMSVTAHDEVIIASDGRSRKIQNEVVKTNGWENLARELASELGLTEAQVKSRALKAGGTRSVKEVNKF